MTDRNNNILSIEINILKCYLKLTAVFNERWSLFLSKKFIKKGTQDNYLVIYIWMWSTDWLRRNWRSELKSEKNDTYHLICSPKSTCKQNEEN